MHHCQPRRWLSARASIVVLILSLLSILPFPVLSQSDCDTCISFSQLNKADVLPWSARAGATLLLHPREIHYHNASNSSQSIIAPPGSLVIFGGDAAPSPIYNDVWLSSDSGYSWSLIAGNASNGAFAGPSFVPVRYSVVALGGVLTMPDNVTVLNVLKIGGEPEDEHEESFVYATYDMQRWEDRFTHYLPRYQLSAAVINSSGSILLLGGRTTQQDTNAQPVADVWHSPDGGRTWDCLTTSADFKPRFSHSAVRLTGIQATGASDADVVLVVGGTNGPTHFNDVWASSDAVTWKRLTSGAAFSPRRDFSLLATDDGALVLTAGQDTATSFNDIFASFDGGYTWHEYVWPHSTVGVTASLASSRLQSRTSMTPRSRSSVGYSPDRFFARHSHAAAFDARGYLYISGGLGTSQPRSTQQQYLTDIIRSSISFSNSTHLAAVFGAVLSRCGIGLYCFDDSTSVVAGGLVTCTACSEDSVSLLTLCVVVGVVTCAFVAFMVWRNFGVKSQHEKPIGVNEHLVNEDEVDE